MAVDQNATMKFFEFALMHIPYIMHIENRSYPEPWTYNMFRQELENESSFFCVMFHDNILSGYGGFWMIMDEAHITRVTIAPDLRGRGLSRLLMNYLLHEARMRNAQIARLEVRESNLPAIRLYEGLGFLREGRRKAYYHKTNEDAIVMAKQIQ